MTWRGGNICQARLYLEFLGLHVIEGLIHFDIVQLRVIPTRADVLHVVIGADAHEVQVVDVEQQPRAHQYVRQHRPQQGAVAVLHRDVPAQLEIESKV